MLPREMTPSAIVRYLNQYVVGQNFAKQVLAVAVHTHYRRLLLGGDLEAGQHKSNVLLIGPSGTGKTLLCETLAQLVGVPFVTTDATALAQTRYVGQEIEAIMARLVDRAGGDVQKAGHGIVFIDEIDKLKASGSTQGMSGEGVQHALLKIMEGYPVHLGGGVNVNTHGILFICGGAFVGLEQIMARTHSFGFISTTSGDDQNILNRINSRVKPTDLFEFGLIPEFTGRLPIVVRLQELSRQMLVQIMTEPKNSLYQHFRALLAVDGVELEVLPVVFEQIADIAYEYKTGARSLRGIFEELLTPILFNVPDHPEIGKVVIRSLFDPPQFLGRSA